MHPETIASDELTLADAWFVEALAPEGVVSIESSIDQRFPRGILGRKAPYPRVLRGLLWFVAAKDAKRIVCSMSARGLMTFMVLQYLSGRRSTCLYLMEFFRPPVRSGIRNKLVDLVHLWLSRRVLPTLLTKAQVATDWEVDAYAKQYRLPRSRLCHIPRQIVSKSGPLPELTPDPSGFVMASGHAACDWPTLFSAAKGADWPLTVVCSAADYDQVMKLNRDGRATVLSEIPGEEHARLLSAATAYALVLREQRASSGHVRLGRAIEAGIPLVASSVIALQGYLEPDVTAIAVPPGDPVALRSALDGLMESPEARLNLRNRAYEAVRGRTLERYIAQIRELAFGTAPTAGSRSPVTRQTPAKPQPEADS